MPKPAVGDLGPELDDAIQRYVNEGQVGDINSYLDALGLAHPTLIAGGRFEQRMPICGDGYHPVPHSYYNKHDGEHMWWTCDVNG